MSRYIDAECDCVTEVINRRAFNSREDVQDFLDNIPTADVAPVKHGHWDNISESCSVCPYCGCKMDEDRGDDKE